MTANDMELAELNACRCGGRPVWNERMRSPAEIDGDEYRGYSLQCIGCGTSVGQGSWREVCEAWQLRSGMTPPPWKLGRLLSACGYTEVPAPARAGATRDAIGIKIEPTAGTDMPSGPLDLLPLHTSFDFEGRFPVMTVSVDAHPASAAYALAAAMQHDLLMQGEAAVTVRREGDRYFAEDVLDALHAAGCTVEDRADGCTIHLPNTGGSIDGRALAMAVSKPVTAEELRCVEATHEHWNTGPWHIREKPDAHDYLRHDPTKRHTRRRRRR